MSDPDPTTAMAYWLDDNLAKWLSSKEGAFSHQEFVRVMLPHISALGVNAIFQLVQQDFDEENLPFYNPGGTNGDD
jgi:hypothetical protein